VDNKDWLDKEDLCDVTLAIGEVIRGSGQFYVLYECIHIMYSSEWILIPTVSIHELDRIISFQFLDSKKFVKTRIGFVL